MKIFTVCAMVLSSLLVLAWPVVFFFSIFLFDAPLHGLAEIARSLVALSIWAYPFGYVVAIALLVSRRQGPKGLPWFASPTGFLFLLPFAHLAVALWAGTIVLG